MHNYIIIITSWKIQQSNIDIYFAQECAYARVYCKVITLNNETIPVCRYSC